MKHAPNYPFLLFLMALALGLLLMSSCKTHYFRYNYRSANSLLHDSDSLQTKLFLKLHLTNGDVCILADSWEVDTLKDRVSGIGTRYDFNRTQIHEGDISLSIDEIAIMETNQKLGNTESGRMAIVGIVVGLEAVIGIICATNPKACFGSCPTFYLNEADPLHFSDAEGFSNAIAPSLEYVDVDALHNPPVSGSVFSLTMKNEALETHCVKHVRLLAYPRNEGEYVFHAPDDQFYLCDDRYPLLRATAPEGEVTDLLREDDRNERTSLADAHNLSSKEEIYLDFGPIEDAQDLGLAISFRQTLMTTYFIYSAIGYMGDQVADIFARMETDGEALDKLNRGLRKELGDIEVYAWNEVGQQWERKGGWYETGPIALNRQMVPLHLDTPGSSVRLKLLLNKGLWRIDYATLVRIREQVVPVEIRPYEVGNKGTIDPDALAKINSDDAYLISMPGSAYTFQFHMPTENQDYELFLSARGYYLEWMRESWIRDKNLLKLRQMLEHPRTYLKREAKAYKRYEKTMEETFWNSRIDTQTFSYDEN